MIYILIAIWASGGKASIAVEFNTKEACQAAAAQLQHQTSTKYSALEIVFCAAKGEKK